MIPTPIVVAQQCSIIATNEAWTRGNTWSRPSSVSMILLTVVGQYMNRMYLLTNSHTFAFVIKERRDGGFWEVITDAEYDFEQGAYLSWQEVFRQLIRRIDDETEVTLSVDGVLLAGSGWSVAMTTKPREVARDTTNLDQTIATLEQTLEEMADGTFNNALSTEAEQPEQPAKPKRKRIQR